MHIQFAHSLALGPLMDKDLYDDMTTWSFLEYNRGHEASDLRHFIVI